MLQNCYLKQQFDLSQTEPCSAN